MQSPCWGCWYDKGEVVFHPITEDGPHGRLIRTDTENSRSLFPRCPNKKKLWLKYHPAKPHKKLIPDKMEIECVIVTETDSEPHKQGFFFEKEICSTVCRLSIRSNLKMIGPQSGLGFFRCVFISRG